MLKLTGGWVITNSTSLNLGEWFKSKWPTPRLTTNKTTESKDAANTYNGSKGGKNYMSFKSREVIDNPYIIHLTIDFVK